MRPKLTEGIGEDLSSTRATSSTERQLTDT